MEGCAFEMINHFRNFLIVKTVKKSRELIICTDDEYGNFSRAQKTSRCPQLYMRGFIQDTLTKIRAGKRQN
jgi:hypothetical protein